MWILLAIVSAVCLGCYDVSKKQALTSNNTMIVLWLSVGCSSLLLLPILLLSYVIPDIMQPTSFYVPDINLQEHLLVLLKSAIVLASWFFAYLAMKNLPITLVSPINATRPMWTLLGAVLIFHETLNHWQWAGIIIAIVSFFAFSMVGKKEGIQFRHNIYIYALLLGTFLGAVSGLYDKYLMQRLNHNAVQVYYTLYQFLLWTIVVAIVAFGKRKQKEDNFRLNIRHPWWIVGISVFLVLSDFVYLLALSYSDSLISVISTVRRSGVIIPFLYGALRLHDENPKEKAVCLLGVLIGMIFLLIGTL